MRWRGAARTGVALVGLGCALALVVYYRHRPVETPAAVATLTDPTATSQSSGFSELRFNANKEGVETEIAAAQQTTYADGRSRWSKVRVTTKQNGRTFHIVADTAETMGKAVSGDAPGEIRLRGSIKVTAEDGLDLRTDEATYDNVSGIVTMPGAVTFARAGLTGAGVGATYDRTRSVLLLQEQAHISQAPDEKGAGAFDLSARTIKVARNDRFIDMAEHAKIVRAEQTLSSDTAVIHFTADEKGLQQIELHGTASVVPGGGAKNSPEMSASDIIMDFQSDGQNLKHAALMQKARLVQPGDGGAKQVITATNIDLVTAPDGKTLVNLNAKENVVVTLPATPQAPGRVITAPSLVATGDEKSGLKAAFFEGGVQFVESQPGGRGRGAAPEIMRKGTSTRLVLDLGGQIGAITKAEFRDKVTFTDGQMKATADIANYDEVKGIMVLTPAKGSTVAPTADDGSVKVDAQEFIRIDMSTHDLNARGGVHSRMTRAANTGDTHTPALFDASQPVFATAAEMSYVNKTKSAHFSGSASTPANVYQDPDNFIRGAIVELEQDSGNLSATGGVISSFMLETPADKAAPRSVTTRTAPGRPGPAEKPPATPAKASPSLGGADKLEYNDARRTATYFGSVEKPATLKGTGLVEGEQIVVTLGAEGRSLQKLEAARSVYVAFDDGREAVAATLLYDATPDWYSLSGAPMFFKNIDDKDGQRRCNYEKTTDLTYEMQTQSMHIPPGRSLKPTTSIPCDAKLKAISKTDK